MASFALALPNPFSKSSFTFAGPDGLAAARALPILLSSWAMSAFRDFTSLRSSASWVRISSFTQSVWGGCGVFWGSLQDSNNRQTMSRLIFIGIGYGSSWTVSTPNLEYFLSGLFFALRIYAFLSSRR